MTFDENLLCGKIFLSFTFHSNPGKQLAVFLFDKHSRTQTVEIRFQGQSAVAVTPICSTGTSSTFCEV